MEEYVWISKAIHMSIFTAHVYPIMYRLGREWNVEVTIAGPEDTQDGLFIQAIYDAIDRKAAGIMLHGWGIKEEIAAINAAIESGIPVVTVDSDVPNSKRLAHVGTDWFRMGSAMAEQLVSLVGENGIALFRGNVRLANVQTGFRGFQHRMSTYPNVEVLGPGDFSISPPFSHDRDISLTTEWLQSHPDVNGVAGFDYYWGLMFAEAVKETGLAGKVKVVCVDTEPPHIEYIQEGIIQAAFSQRRELFTFQAFKMLYDFNHGSASTGYQPGPINITGNVDTGFTVVTKGNVDSFEDEFNLNEIFEHQALTRRLALMSTVVESSGQMTLAADIEGHVVYANPASFRLTGMAEEQIIGTRIDQIFDFTEANRAVIEQCVATDTPVTFETTARREYERTFPVQLTVSPMKSDVAGRGLALIAADITDRELAAAALQESERRFRTIFDSVNDAILVHDIDTGEILDVNHTMCAMYGYTREEALRLTVEDLSSSEPFYTQSDAQAWIKKAAEGEPQVFEWRAKAKGGRLFWVEVNMRRVAISGRDRILVSVRDITERKRIQETIKEEQQRTRLILETTTVPITISRLSDSKVLYANPALSEVGSIALDKYIGSRTVDFFADPTDMDRIVEALQQHGYVRDFETQFIGDSGVRNWVLLSARLFTYRNEACVLSSYIDISRRKQAEAELRKSEEHAREFQEKLKALQEVSLELVAEESIEKMCGRAVELGHSVLGYDRLGILLFENAEQSKVSRFGIESTGELRVEHGMSYSTENDRTTALVSANRGAVYVSEETVLKDFETAVGRGWNIVTGIWDGNTSIGWMAADNFFGQKPLIPYQVELLKLYGLTVGHLITRKRVEEALRGSEQIAREFQERLRALHQIGLELSAIQTLDSFYYQAVLATKRLGIERCGLFLIDKDQNLVGTYGTDESGNIRDERSLKITLAEDSRELQLVKKAVGAYYWDDVDLRGADQVVGRGWSVLAVLWDGTKAIGLIASDSFLTHQPPRPYTVDLMGLYANLLGNVLTQKRAETEIRKLNEELEQRVLKRTQELQEANEEIRQFVYIVSHDLRAPLVNLKGFASELRSSLSVVMDGCDELLPLADPTKQNRMQRAVQEDIPEALRFIESSVSSMDTFTKTILKLSRLGRLPLEPVELDVRSLVDKTLQALAYEINQRDITVTIGDLPVVVADPLSMEQVFGNILANAVTYLDPNRPGKIEIGAEQKADETVFRIRDNGQGIAKEDMDKVFAPFRRAGKQDAPGEGMGLAYVQALVRRHGGRIWCESEAGIGSTFTFTISRNLKNNTVR